MSNLLLTFENCQIAVVFFFKYILGVLICVDAAGSVPAYGERHICWGSSYVSLDGQKFTLIWISYEDKRWPLVHFSSSSGRDRPCSAHFIQIISRNAFQMWVNKSKIKLNFALNSNQRNRAVWRTRKVFFFFFNWLDSILRRGYCVTVPNSIACSTFAKLLPT